MTAAASSALADAVALRDAEAALELLLLDLPQPYRVIVQDRFRRALRDACAAAGLPLPGWLDPRRGAAPYPW